jgi:adenylate cyclase
MAACGLPRERLDHAHATVQMALDLAFSIKQINLMLGSSIDARFGVHTGPVVAGVTGA